ncbi:metal ABC transporter permease [Bosea psychrotolerans]|uniref:ABC-type Mn2+/Zn2+ transport system permease subunit n=1 Tax=Bosea psychrotolerans TaxID=1871628 RepID=A0A2S4LWK0_9HYPH|nr:metal ABC transporter permease [Bosea psychrotolerans]POR46820.1 ABC-type Mn2+/Zn2+ transport system permease subunit [Bosea psychrotolerans]
MTMLHAWFLSPFAHEFMLRGLAVAVLVGIVCAMLSCFLVLKGWALMGDAVSHAVLPGIVLAYSAGLPLIVGAFASGLACAFGIGYIKENSRVKEDTVMGIVFSGMFAFGLVLFVKVESDQHLNHILFGNLLGLRWNDIAETALIAVPTIAILLLKRRDLLLHAFDPAHARAIGLNVRLLHFGLLTILALTIVAALKAVGIILVVAMLVAPGAIGYLTTRQFDWMLLVAVGAATLSSVLGTILSFHLDAATGPCIVVVQAAFFLVALAGNLMRASRRARAVQQPG